MCLYNVFSNWSQLILFACFAEVFSWREAYIWSWCPVYGDYNIPNCNSSTPVCGVRFTEVGEWVQEQSWKSHHNYTSCLCSICELLFSYLATLFFFLLTTYCITFWHFVTNIMLILRNPLAILTKYLLHLRVFETFKYWKDKMLILCTSDLVSFIGIIFLWSMLQSLYKSYLTAGSCDPF